jgi:membrane-associated phospholipid phosphatase
LFVFASSAVSIINRPLQWIIGRIRPFKIDHAPDRLDPWYVDPFRGGMDGLRIAKNLCFPSGHATLTFATAAALGMLWPRWRWLWYSIAGVVAIERVLENAHWLSDCVAGAALGIGGVHLVAWILSSWKIDHPTDSPTSRS